MNSGGEPIRTAPIYPNVTQRDGARGDGASAETPVRIDKVNLYIARKLGRDRVRVECNCLILNCSCCGGKGFYFVDVPPKQEEVESLRQQCQRAGVPYFEKGSIAKVVDRPLVQEWPK